MKKIVTLYILLFSIQASAQHPLFIPDTLSGPNYVLSVHEDSMPFFAGAVSHTYSFNSNHYLGPTLIFNKGSNVNITVNNLLTDTTTVHWHGIHVPAIWDGGPFSPILPGETWNPTFTIKDNAATYWYHPHLHMKTAEQAIRGAAGLIIVRDAVESSLMLPRRYGIDDFPLIVQCQQYDSLNQAMPKGMQDSTLLVNGTMDPFLNAPAQMVRLRLLNASGERTFNFGFSANKQFYQIASDGGLLNTPYLTTRLRLAPGERAEIVVDLSGMNGEKINLVCYGSELPIGVQGGPTMPMPKGSPPMDSPLNGVDYKVMQIHVIAQTVNPVTAIPNTLTTNSIYPEAASNITRTIRFTADSLMVMDGPFYFNDSSFDMMRIDYTIHLNSVEIWKLVNQTMVAHPFHIHDVQFFILDRNGIAPNPNEMGRKDVVLVAPGDSVRFITKFTDYTDPMIPYMFHCHILMHEDDGMMGQFVVVPDAAGSNEISEVSKMNIFPNPASGNITLQTEMDIHNAEMEILNSLGETVIMKTDLEKSKKEMDISRLPVGIYFLQLRANGRSYSQKFLKQ